MHFVHTHLLHTWTAALSRSNLGRCQPSGGSWTPLATQQLMQPSCVACWALMASSLAGLITRYHTLACTDLSCICQFFPVSQYGICWSWTRQVLLTASCLFVHRFLLSCKAAVLMLCYLCDVSAMRLHSAWTQLGLFHADGVLNGCVVCRTWM